jgi:dihydrofolate reductase
MKISIIVAIADDYAIGKDNKLLWHLSDDLKRFKKLTTGKVVIMGQKTYESLPIRPLPKRISIVITDNPDLSFFECQMANSIEDSIEKSIYWTQGEDEIFIMGGASIYRQFFDKADRLYITRVHATFEDADVFFPEIKEDEWNLVFEEDHAKDENNEYDYTYQIYEKIK